MSNHFLVALAVGGLMEQPEVTYRDYQVVEAKTKEIARQKYNKENNVSYFSGKVIASVINCEKVLEKLADQDTNENWLVDLAMEGAVKKEGT